MASRTMARNSSIAVGAVLLVACGARGTTPERGTPAATEPSVGLARAEDPPEAQVAEVGATPAHAERREALSGECRVESKKIEDVFNNYVGPTPERILERLQASARTLEQKDCPAWLRAVCWMYIGVAQGSGLGKLDEARKAFDQALSLDQEVRLDEDLATPETKRAFEDARSAALAGSSPAKGLR
jgi:hypothetical protein